MQKFPTLVCQLTMTCEAWIVGSAAKVDIDLTQVRDFDVMVPHAYWYHAAQLIPKDAKPTIFGGWECLSEGLQVDVWPDDLSRLLIDSHTSCAWQPRYNTRVVKL